MLASFGFDDMDLARRLQEEYDKEAATQLAAESDFDLSRSRPGNFSSENNSSHFGSPLRSPPGLGISPVDPSLEVTDPNPDIRELFLQFNAQFFWSRLSGIEVKWSPRMTLCAGLCVYEGHGGLCSVRLSLPLLKLRPRKDLVETLLHEMIHAFLFVTDHEKDHDDHGPNFKKHMNRINKETGASISIYHTFHDEVASYQQHWWKCDGPCQKRPPYFGMVRRAMNRPPSNRDPWFNEHQSTCGGTFIKVKEPEGYGQKKGKGKIEKSDKAQNANSDIRAFIGKGAVLGGPSVPVKSLSNGSVKGSGGTVKREDSKGKGLSVITNGILTHKKDPDGLEKRPGVMKLPGKSSSPLFSSVASTSGSSMSKSTNPVPSTKTPPSSGLNKSLSSNRPPASSSGQSSQKNIKGKGKFNDNITLLELFKRRQAREKARQDGAAIKKKQDYDDIQDKVEKESIDNEFKVSKPTKLEVSGDFKGRDDFLVDLTGSDTDDFNTASSSTDSTKRHSDVCSKNKGNEKRWKKIFPTMSGKKDRGKFKGTGKSKFSRNFVSVCEGGFYDDVKARKKRPSGDKKKRKYVIDELDSNDGLWDESNSSTSASEEKLVKSFSKTSDLIHSCEKSLPIKDLSESDGEGERNPNHQDSNLNADFMKNAAPNKTELDTASSTSGLNGHVLGKGETGLSFLAQMRRKMKDERKPGQNNLQLERNVDSSKLSAHHDTSSNKRRSDVAFGDDKIVPTSKRPSNVRSEGFITENQEEREEVSEEAAPGMVACPVCTQFVRESGINDHLDQCLV
ncbi:sprT-like domain-containing protein Spartan [Elysia marginata]|uniref:Protein with SprT-like domain at the N terminus n=1 Tax=Elysia marginata TaxID=1093978 RepID=A0AAV4HQY8_9GAST|nr:sprT-like domain-containing protein Spartan [Elysia marginata]